ncbi:hypothetical protein LINGRAHAP2_LOCUS14208 [Linum grandiflorum]
MLLRDLTPENPPSQLQLLLRHAWKLGNLAAPTQFFGLGTIWTDAEGVRIKGDSQWNFSEVLLRRITVKAVYKISVYIVCASQPNF